MGDRRPSAIEITFSDCRTYTLSTPANSLKQMSSSDAPPNCCVPPTPPVPNPSSNTPLIAAPSHPPCSYTSVTRLCG
eukprot:51534-Pleurochrysis_carterae.AAC.1